MRAHQLDAAHLALLVDDSHARPDERQRRVAFGKVRIEQAEGRANRHLDEIEAKMAKIAELEEQLELNNAAFKKEKDALRQAHRDEMAQMEAMHAEAMQASASRLAEVQASNRRSVEAMQAAQVAAADNHANAGRC